jgi:hypothetical protein
MMPTIQPSKSITTGSLSTAAASLNPDNLHHEFRTLSLLVTVAATISNPAQYYPELEVDINKGEDSGLNHLATETRTAYQSSVMHAMTSILVVNAEVLAGMNYAGDHPNMLISLADERVAVTDDDVLYHMDVEALKLVTIPNPDLRQDQRWGVKYKDRGCI